MSVTAPSTRRPARAAMRTGLGVFASGVAFSAYVGAVGLASGALSLEAPLNDRLPFHTAVFAGLALAVIVGMPFTVVAWLAFTRDHRTDAASLLAGVLLVGWIVVEFSFIRELSFFHPLYIGVGLTFALLGRRSVGPSEGPRGQARIRPR